MTAVNEVHVYSCNNEQVGPTSSLLVSDYIISVFTLKGRIFTSRDCVLYHCLGQLPYLRPTNCIIVPQSIPVYWQSQWETHRLSVRVVSWGLYKRIPWPLSVSGISQAQQAPYVHNRSRLPPPRRTLRFSLTRFISVHCSWTLLWKEDIFLLFILTNIQLIPSSYIMPHEGNMYVSSDPHRCCVTNFLGSPDWDTVAWKGMLFCSKVWLMALLFI